MNVNFEKGIILTKNTYIRKNKSGFSPITYELKEGDAVYIHEKNKVWTKVTIEENVGYIRTNSISVI